MKINFLDSYPVISLLRFISLILRKLPISAALWIGQVMGRVFFFSNSRAKRIAYANLKLAFSYKLTPSEIKKILAGLFRNMGMNIVEVLRFPSIDEKYIEKYVKIFGFEKIKNSLDKRKGLILLTAHFGNWEFSPQASSLKGFPMMVLATEQKHSALNNFLDHYRSLHGCEVISKGWGLREILKGIKENKIVGVLCDQDGGSQGLETDFFGRSAMTARGPFEIAYRNFSQILPCFIVRGKNGHHILYIEDSISIKDNQLNKDDILKTWAGKFNHLLEKKIAEFPAQWLWTLKRWKSSKERAVVVLSDGKAGHLNQAKAAAQAITEKLSELGFKALGDYQFKRSGYKIIEVKFKNKWRENLFKLNAHFLNSKCQGCLRCLKFALTKESFLNLQNCFADIFISAGSALAGVNLLLAKENLAKSVVVMKPQLPISRFDLAIIPAHDVGPVADKKIIRTLGAPVYLDSKFIEEKSKELNYRLKLKNPYCISLFFGGQTPTFIYDPGQIKKIVEAAKVAAARLDTKILVTTSRRSPAWLEDFLEKEFSQEEKCAFLLIANKVNMPDAVAAFLGLTGVAVVSGESISMVTEAASTDRQLIVFLPPKRKAASTKQERLIQQLEKEGYLKIMDEDLKSQIISLFSAGSKKALISNKDKIKEAVKFLV